MFKDAQLSLGTELGPDLLATVYLRAKHEGLLESMFWEQAPELTGFLRWCERPDCVIVGCFVGPTLAGIGWVENIKRRCGKRLGDVGELFFKAFQVHGPAGEFGAMLVDFAFQDLGFDLLTGFTPETNVAAVRYMRHQGFRQLASVPHLACFQGQSCGGVLSFMDRVAWEESRQKRGNHKTHDQLHPVA